MHDRPGERQDTKWSPSPTVGVKARRSGRGCLPGVCSACGAGGV